MSNTCPRELPKQIMKYALQTAFQEKEKPNAKLEESFLHNPHIYRHDMKFKYLSLNIPYGILTWENDLMRVE
jgi:hypothetical protein